jgi:hypothetical protein
VAALTKNLYKKFNMKCPKCSTENCYQPLIGKPECVNFDCSFFSQEHYNKTTQENSKHSEQSGSACRITLTYKHDI